VDSDLESIYTPAAWKALERFPVEAASVELIDHSENVTYRVQVRDRELNYVLRLHRPGYNSLEELESEREWTRALNEFGLSAPDPLMTRDGAHFVLTGIPATNEQRYVGMTTWIDGEPLYQCLKKGVITEERQRICTKIGALAARMHDQSSNWNEPPGFTRPRLDTDGLLGDSPRWGRFWEHTELQVGDKKLLLKTRKKLQSALSVYGQRAASFGLIHADLDSENIIVSDQALAIIDFDDSAYGWHMYDIASALIEYCYAPDFDALRDALLDGYQAHRPLESRDVEMLPAFLLIRGMAIVGWYHERPEHAGSRDFEKVKDWILEQCESIEL